MDTVLLVVDVQKELIDGHPYNEENVIRNIKNLIETCRKSSIEVVYIRHDGGIGDELEYGTEGWEIYHEIGPLPGEKIIEKQYNSAFRKTNLKEYLDERKVKNIILVGMQTEYCIDATCKVAFEYGYDIIVPKDTTTTYGNTYMTGKELCEFYENIIWNNRYAKVISVQSVLEDIRGK